MTGVWPSSPHSVLLARPQSFPIRLHRVCVDYDCGSVNLLRERIGLLPIDAGSMDVGCWGDIYDDEIEKWHEETERTIWGA